MERLFEAGFGFTLVLFRTSGLIVSAPIISARFIPMRVKMALVISASVAAYLGAGMPRIVVPASVVELVGLGVVEAAIGLLGGLAARHALDAASAAGTYAASLMGLNYGSMLDPINGVSSNAVTELTNILAVSLGIAAGLHREAMGWLARSLVAQPPGSVVDLSGAFMAAVGHGVGGLALAIRLGYPFILVTTFGHVLFAFIGRSAPQLNVSSLGFSVSLLAGGGALYLAAPIAAEVAVRVAMEALTR
jgi:flagellar biosynthetic protein FliR